MTPGHSEPDHDPVALDGIADFDDPREAEAIALHRLSFATPDEVASMLSGEHGRAELARTWALLEPADRNLARRRIEVLAEARELAERRAEARG